MAEATERRLCRVCGRYPARKTGLVCWRCTSNRTREKKTAAPHHDGTWDVNDEFDLLRDFCRKDFWAFFLYAFGAWPNPRGKRWIEREVHEPLARWFQMHVDEWLENRRKGLDEQKHLAILVHREVGKTTMITRAGQAWLHARDPEMSTYTGAENRALSHKMLAAIKAVLDGSDPHALFTHLFGNWSTGARTWSGSEIVHAARKNTSRQDPSFGTFAVETSITGAHPDAIFYDDPISYERLRTDSNWLETVNSQVSSLIPVIQSDGLIVWVGTRYDTEDHFGVAFSGEGVKTVTGIHTDSIPMEKDGKWHVYFLAGRDAEGKPTTPKVWPEERLRRYERADPLRYAAQVMNDPSLSGHNPITMDQLRQCIIPAKQVPWSALRFAITCDTAFWDGTKQTRKDESVYLVWGYPRDGSGDAYFIEGYGSPTWRAEDFAKRLVSTVQRYRAQGRRVFAITDEVTMSGKKDAWKLSLTNFFNDANEPMPTFHELKRHSVKKEVRLGASTSFWVDGHVRMVEGAPGIDRLMKQMSSIGQYAVNPRIKIDWADAAADAFSPQLYVPMRRQMQQSAPWVRGAQAIPTEGVNPADYEDDDVMRWREQVPREPLH